MKPENILIGEDGYVKLADYGLSKEIKHRPTSLCGTAEYFSPEMFQQKEYDFSVDWWSLGQLIYELLVG